MAEDDDLEELLEELRRRWYATATVRITTSKKSGAADARIPAPPDDVVEAVVDARPANSVRPPAPRSSS